MIEFEISTNKKQIDFDITQGVPKYVPANFQSKTVVPTTEQQVVRADKPYDGLEQVTVEPIKVLDKTITQNGAYSANEENIDGYSSVFVNIQPTLQEKSITITENGTTEVVADSGYDGLAKVSIEANVKDNSLLNVIKGMNSYQTTNYPFELTADMFGDGEYLRHGFIRDNFNLTKVTFPEHIKRTSQYCFYNCKNLKSVDMNSIERIEAYTFQDCTSLTSIDAPNATYVNFDAFKNCTELEEVNIHNAGLGTGYIFSYCSKLKSLIFSKEKTVKIGNNEFEYCRSLTSIDLPNVTTISSNAFYNSGLVSINIPNVTSIGNYAFQSCDKLTHIDLPNVTTLNAYMFYDCKSLRYVNIASIQNISGNYTFRNCSNLAVVDMRNTTVVPKMNYSYSNNFQNVPKTCKFIIPDSLYDSWITSTNWSAMYASGYQFIKASEYTEV